MKQIRRFLLDYTVKEWTHYTENGRHCFIPIQRDVHYHHYAVGKSKRYYKQVLMGMGAKNVTIKETRVRVGE